MLVWELLRFNRLASSEQVVYFQLTYLEYLCLFPICMYVWKKLYLFLINITFEENCVFFNRYKIQLFE